MSATKDRADRARAATPPRGRRRRAVLPWIGIAVVVAVAFGVALLAGGGGGDDDVSTGDGGTPAALATADVRIGGEGLPPLEGDDDPAVGRQAPTLEGVAPDGSPATVAPTGTPTLLAFLAHWCPHCQAELPRLVDLADAGGLEGVRPVAVLTGTDDSRPNFPPAAWLEREGWDGEVLVDDDDQPAAGAFGLTSYPFLVLLDGDGTVIARSAGELGTDGLREFLAQASA